MGSLVSEALCLCGSQSCATAYNQLWVGLFPLYKAFHVLWGGWSEAGSVWLCERGSTSEDGITEVINPGGWGGSNCGVRGSGEGCTIGKHSGEEIIELDPTFCSWYPLLYLF